MRYSILMLAIAIGCASAQTEKGSTVTVVNLRRGPGIQPDEAPAWVTAGQNQPRSLQPRISLSDADSVIIRAGGSTRLEFQIGWAILDTLRHNIFSCGGESVLWNYSRADSVDTQGIPRETFIGKWTQDYNNRSVAEVRLAIPAARFRKLMQSELQYVTDNIMRDKARQCLSQRGLM